MTKNQTAKRGRKHRQFLPEYCDLMIKLAENGRWITQFCREIRCSTKLFYEWKRSIPEFAKAIDVAQAAYQAWWEDRGIEGLHLSSREFNTGVWIYNMKCRFDDWREKTQVETVDNSQKAKFIAPEQYNDLDQWSAAYHKAGSKNVNNT